MRDGRRTSPVRAESSARWLLSALLAAGCASATNGVNTDGGTDAPIATIDGGRCPATVTLAELCARPERYDGCELDLHGTIAARNHGTAVGCTCCNANQ